MADLPRQAPCTATQGIEVDQVQLALPTFASLPAATDQQPEIPTIQLIHPSYQPMREELAEDISVEATLEERGQVVTRPVEVEYYKPNRQRR